MSEQHPSVIEMWNRFIGSHPEFEKAKYDSWYFCDNEKCANELCELVIKGIKRGTASLLFWYEKDKEPLPEAGEFSVVTNWDGIAKCVIRAVKITIIKFRDVDEKMAAIEGEGDGSLEYWRKAHISFFTRELKEAGMNFSEEMEIVFEEFELVCK